MKNYELIVEEEYQYERIDKYICEVLADFSRTYIQKLISEGDISVNGKACKASYKVMQSDRINVVAPDSVLPDIKAEDIPLDILYEDEDVLVVNKPKGMVVHPAPGHFENTLVNAVMFHCKDNLSGINGVMRPGIVHRIDKDTSGSVIICKNDRSHESIASQLKEHSIRREYIAIVEGRIEEESGIIDKPIGRSSSDRKKMAVNVSNSKNAITHYEVLERFSSYSYVKCILETGRTHQIRVHMASIGHPIAGDEIYGSHKKTPVITDGQTLHARVLGFVHPSSGEYIETIAPAPQYLEDFLSSIRHSHFESNK